MYSNDQSTQFPLLQTEPRKLYVQLLDLFLMQQAKNGLQLQFFENGNHGLSEKFFGD